MLVVLTETYCNKVNIQITKRDDFKLNLVIYKDHTRMHGQQNIKFIKISCNVRNTNEILEC